MNYEKDRVNEYLEKFKNIYHEEDFIENPKTDEEVERDIDFIDKMKDEINEYFKSDQPKKSGYIKVKDMLNQGIFNKTPLRYMMPVIEKLQEVTKYFYNKDNFYNSKFKTEGQFVADHSRLPLGKNGLEREHKLLNVYKEFLEIDLSELSFDNYVNLCDKVVELTDLMKEYYESKDYYKKCKESVRENIKEYEQCLLDLGYEFDKENNRYTKSGSMPCITRFKEFELNKNSLKRAYEKGSNFAEKGKKANFWSRKALDFAVLPESLGLFASYINQSITPIIIGTFAAFATYDAIENAPNILNGSVLFLRELGKQASEINVFKQAPDCFEKIDEVIKTRRTIEASEEKLKARSEEINKYKQKISEHLLGEDAEWIKNNLKNSLNQNNEKNDQMEEIKYQLANESGQTLVIQANRCAMDLLSPEEKDRVLYHRT